MIFTAVWNPSSLDELADLWLNAPDRSAVTQAANRIDQLLKQDPYANSESRSGNSRVMIEPPLVVNYEVSDDDCLVTVLGVWRSQ